MEDFKCPCCDKPLPVVFIIGEIMKFGGVKKFERDDKGKVTWEFHK